MGLIGLIGFVGFRVLSWCCMLQESGCDFGVMGQLGSASHLGLSLGRTIKMVG